MVFLYLFFETNFKIKCKLDERGMRNCFSYFPRIAICEQNKRVIVLQRVTCGDDIITNKYDDDDDECIYSYARSWYCSSPSSDTMSEAISRVSGASDTKAFLRRRVHADAHLMRCATTRRGCMEEEEVPQP